MRTILLIFLLFFSAPLTAQDRQGNDTPGDWVVDHYKPFGLWDSICDHRITDGVKEERCYIRYVEVFNPRPAFAAKFIFVTPGPEVEIGLERGTLFPKGGMRIEHQGGLLWSTNHILCRTGISCTFNGEAAENLLAAMAEGTTFAFDFRDRHGVTQALRWDLSQFADALEDHQREAAARNL